MLRFELKHGRKPAVAMMGLAFKPDIDDLRESPAKGITTKVLQSCNNADIMVVEPNGAADQANLTFLDLVDLV